MASRLLKAAQAMRLPLHEAIDHPMLPFTLNVVRAAEESRDDDLKSSIEEMDSDHRKDPLSRALALLKLIHRET